tara:strand:- start:1424 stop:2788 length:1365 start_codon:yes stop_codon:yes gene_type:complete
VKILLNLIIFFVLTINSSFAENVDPVKNLLKTITGKSLNKEQTQKFLSEYVIIIEDERGDGLVTYLFDDRNYIRYKNYEQISTGAWRFTKTGQLRVFNQDVKLTWKIQIGKNNDNKINIKPKFDPLGKLYGFNYQAKEDFLSELSDYKEQLALEKKRLEQEKIDAKKKVEEEKAKLEQEKLEAQKKVEQEKAKAAEEKAKLEQEKLEAQKKAEEEKAKLEQEKLEAQQKAEEEKAKLEAEKAALEKEIAEQKKQLELEKLYIQLEPEFRRKCIKKALNDLYEVGTPEYKTCIINKGPEKQLKEAEENKIKLEKEAEENKIKLEQEKLEAQQKAKEKEEKLNQEKLAAQKKANELEKLKGSTDWNKLFDAIAKRWMSASQPTPGMDETLTHLCLWKKINKSYLTGNHLIDNRYNMGPRVEVYDKLDPIFSQFDQTVGETINVDVSCDDILKRFSK